MRGNMHRYTSFPMQIAIDMYSKLRIADIKNPDMDEIGVRRDMAKLLLHNTYNTIERDYIIFFFFRFVNQI